VNEKERTDLTDLTEFLFPDRVTDQVVLNELLNTASTAERIGRFKYREKEKTKDLCLQIHKDKILAYCNNTPDSPPCVLKNRDETESFCLELFECERAMEPFAHGIPALLMSKKRFEELKKGSDSSTVHRLSECLAAETGDDVHSNHLARVMKCFDAEGELRLCISSENGWKFQYASFISDHSSGWLLRMSSDPSQDWIVALPISKAQLCGSVAEWVFHSSSFPSPQ
jgi:hypothetical protein